jgi:diguanylate cyclase (GGDEF)-like protein
VNILIAEDDAVSRRILEKAVQLLGHTTCLVPDGEAAWEALQRAEFDVVVSDWMMPGCDGLELCRRVREHMAASSTYIYFIILTALDNKKDFVKAMEAQADDFLTKPLDRVDLQARLNVAQRVTSLYREVVEQRSELTRQKAEVERLNREFYEQARTDTLTQVGNRLRLREDLDTLCGRVDRYGHTCALALFDIDYFKRYNDHYGHLAGDDVLRTIAANIKAKARQGDAIYRYGGEEFLVVLPEQTLETAAIAGERLRKGIEDLAIIHEGRTPPGIVTISVGVSIMLAQPELSIATVLKEADEALYQSKEAGRNRVSIYGQTSEP